MLTGGDDMLAVTLFDILKSRGQALKVNDGSSVKRMKHNCGDERLYIRSNNIFGLHPNSERLWLCLQCAGNNKTTADPQNPDAIRLEHTMTPTLPEELSSTRFITHHPILYEVWYLGIGSRS